ncbi:hypothetical protein LCGC14_0503610 [marine sediment metagenome]|uniref:Uncharacterized protein n=1 Tax=marine sediment metagenome TaxID=412755 RepID=A0A0F9VBQ0_9ZZZZ
MNATPDCLLSSTGVANKIAGIKRIDVEIQAEELKKNQININYEKI